LSEADDAIAKVSAKSTGGFYLRLGGAPGKGATVQQCIAPSA
jgi:hypothetical protein